MTSSSNPAFGEDGVTVGVPGLGSDLNRNGNLLSIVWDNLIEPSPLRCRIRRSVAAKVFFVNSQIVFATHELFFFHLSHSRNSKLDGDVVVALVGCLLSADINLYGEVTANA